MITLPEAKILACECEKRLKGAYFKRASLVDEKKWNFEFDQVDDVLKLLICLKRPFSRFHISSRFFKPIPSQWISVVDKSLKGSLLQSCRLLGEDRILELTFTKGETTYFLIFELFSSRAYLLDGERKILANTPKKIEGVYSTPPRSFEPSSDTASCTSTEIEERYRKEEEGEELLEKREKVGRALQKMLKKVQAQRVRAEETLNEAQTWTEQEHTAQLLKANFSLIKRGMTRIELEDWENEGKKVGIDLDPTLLPVAQVDKFFKKARKLKKGLPYAGEFFEKKKEELKEIEIALLDLSAIETLQALEELCLRYKLLPPPPQKKERHEPKKRLPYRTFTTENGLIIMAGKSAHDGDTLTLTIANGSDYRFHVANYPGSHVVLKPKKGEDPDQESIRDAALIALYFSKAKNAGSGDITATQVKHVSKPKGAKPGLVNVSRHKKIHAHLDEKRLFRLLKGAE